MTEQEYNAAEGIRRSDLWRMHDSPEKFRWFLEHPEDPTPALIFGTAAHKLLLEPETFDDEFAVAPNIDRRTKAGKEAWAQVLEAVGDRVLLTEEDGETIRGMVSKARSIPFVSNMLDGEHEKAFFWVDPDTYISCKARIDMLANMQGNLVIGDYKTASNAGTDAFNRDIFKYGYHLQAYMYTEAVRVNLKLAERPGFVFVVQEKKAPYSVNVVRATEDVVLSGMDCFRELMGRLKQCMESGYWYGYNGIYGEPNEAYLPAWMYGEEEE